MKLLHIDMDANDVSIGAMLRMHHIVRRGLEIRDIKKQKEYLMKHYNEYHTKYFEDDIRRLPFSYFIFIRNLAIKHKSTCFYAFFQKLLDDYWKTNCAGEKTVSKLQRYYAPIYYFSTYHYINGQRSPQTQQPQTIEQKPKSIEQTPKPKQVRFNLENNQTLYVEKWIQDTWDY